MKWWWSPWRKRAWLKQEAAYRSARFDLFYGALTDPRGHDKRQAACDALKPEGWTREIEMRRWSTWNPKASRWTA